MSKFEKEQVYEYPEVLICGYGIVGKHLKEEFPFANTYDPDPDMEPEYIHAPKVKYDIAFICVPTPNDKSNKCDLQYVERCLLEVDAGLYVLKSTVPPSTTDYLANKYNRQIIFSPEYHGNTQFSDIDNFVIIGGDDEEYHKLRQLYELTHDATLTYHHCSRTEAEIIKYMENSFLALKVTFCNQFKDIADMYGASYEHIRDGFILDKRVGESHTSVFDKYRGYDSKCLNKDIPALVTHLKERDKDFASNFIMNSVIKINNKYRELKDESDKDRNSKA